MEDEIRFICLKCKQEEIGQVSCESIIKARMEHHLNLFHTDLYITEKDFDELVMRHRHSIDL